MQAKANIKAAEAIATAIDKAVQRALDSLGVATKKDIKALEVRIDKLEAWASAAPVQEEAWASSRQQVKEEGRRKAHGQEAKGEEGFSLAFAQFASAGKPQACFALGPSDTFAQRRSNVEGRTIQISPRVAALGSM